MFSGLLFFLFVKLFVCFCKAENIVIYILIHTIQLNFSLNSKIAQICFVILPNLLVGKLNHYSLILTLV